MPPVRLFDTFPPEVQRRFNEEAAARGWGDLRGLSEWLAAEGYTLGKTAVGEVVQGLKAEYDETMREVRAMAELARIMVDSDPDQQASLNDLAGRLMTDQLVRAAKELRGAQDLPIEERIPLLRQLAQPITQAQRAAVYSRRWSAEQRKEAEAAAKEAAREAAKAAGLDDATAERIATGVQIYLPDNQRRGAGSL
jgi:hypothetical protein